MTDDDDGFDVDAFAQVLAERETRDIALVDESGQELSAEMLELFTQAMIEAGVLVYDDSGKLRPAKDIPVGKVLSVEFDLESNEVSRPEIIDEDDISYN